MPVRRYEGEEEYDLPEAATSDTTGGPFGPQTLRAADEEPIASPKIAEIVCKGKHYPCPEPLPVDDFFF